MNRRIELSGRRLAAVALLLLLTGLTGVAVAESWNLDRTAWSRPRSGEVVRSMPPVAEAVREWQSREEADLALIYPGGEEGELWAAELRDWLIALGVEAEAVRLQPGAPDGDTLVLRVR